MTTGRPLRRRATDARRGGPHNAASARANGEGARVGRSVRRWLEKITRSSPIVEGTSLEEQRDEALEFVLKALSNFNEVRYSLPTLQWRQTWVDSLTATYGLALEIASEMNDSHLLAG
jgi:hypothetical protein